jgi:hypothetical protein
MTFLLVLNLIFPAGGVFAQENREKVLETPQVVMSKECMDKIFFGFFIPVMLIYPGVIMFMVCRNIALDAQNSMRKDQPTRKKRKFFKKEGTTQKKKKKRRRSFLGDEYTPLHHVHYGSSGMQFGGCTRRRSRPLELREATDRAQVVPVVVRDQVNLRPQTVHLAFVHLRDQAINIPPQLRQRHFVIMRPRVEVDMPIEPSTWDPIPFGNERRRDPRYFFLDEDGGRPLRHGDPKVITNDRPEVDLDDPDLLSDPDLG